MARGTGRSTNEGKRVRLKKLPRRGHWEVAVLMPPGVRDPLRGGELLVADASTGELRFRGSLGEESLSELFTRAALHPQGPHRRGRPRSLRTWAGLQEDLRPIADAMGCKVAVKASLPAIEALHEGPEPAPRPAAAPPPADAPVVRVPSEGAAWREVLPQLAAAAPWDQLPQGASIHVGSPEVDEVTIELDPSQGVPALTACPADAHPQDQLEAMAGGHGDGQFVIWRLLLSPVAELGPQRQQWIDASLVVELGGVPHGLVLQKMTLRGFTTPTPGEEQRLAAVLGVVADVVQRQGGDWPDEVARLATPGTDWVVRYEPPDDHLTDAQWLDGVDYSMKMADDGSQLAFEVPDRGAAEEAMGQWGKLDNVDALLHAERDGALEISMASGPYLGALWFLPLTPPFWRSWWVERSSIDLVMTCGGEEIGRREIPLATRSRIGLTHATADEAQQVSAGDYAGDADDWPELARVLWAFAEPLRGDRPDAEALSLGVEAWNALRMAKGRKTVALPVDGAEAEALRAAWRAWAQADPRRVESHRLCDDGTLVAFWVRKDHSLR